MIIRYRLKCRSCDEVSLIRIGLGTAEEEKFAYQCPKCKVILRGVLKLDYRRRDWELKSEDFEMVPQASVPDDALPALSIYTDLPVHKSRMGMSLGPIGSAFLSLIEFIGNERFPEYLTRSHMIQRMRLETLPILRRAARHYVARDLKSLGKVLSKTAGQDARQDPDDEFQRLFGLLYGPLQPWDNPIGWELELHSLLQRSRSANETAYGDTMAEMVEKGGFPEYRRKVVNASISCFEKVDAILPPLAYEYFTDESKAKWAEFRIFRDDFEELKVLYMDVFELASRCVPYVGLFANLLGRGNPWLWADGKSRSLKSAMRLKAADREFILDELPKAKLLYQGISRKTRNKIGHYKVEHDIETGSLVDERGERTNFLLFLSDFLGAVRMTAYLLLFTGAVTLDYERFSKHRSR